MVLTDKKYERNLNNVVNKTSNRTPFEMLHGYIPRFNDGLLRKVAAVYAEEWRDPMKILKKTCKETERHQQKVKHNYNKKISWTISYEPEEIVTIRCSTKHVRESTKTLPKYRVPIIIIDVLPNYTYRVAHL